MKKDIQKSDFAKKTKEFQKAVAISVDEYRKKVEAIIKKAEKRQAQELKKKLA